MYKNVKGGGRVAWLDNVKMYAMLWVILGHVMTIVIKTNVDLSGRVMEHFIVAFNMLLFVMLSGYSNFNAFNRIVDKQGLWNFIKKSTIRILLPVVTFCGHYKIFCVNGNTGFRNESRIFYFIHLQNEEAYERKESSSA